jgi:hypothetical protein
LANYEIEIGEDKQSSVCQCCERESSVGHGFVYKDGDAYAIYSAAWSTMHSQPKISFALAIGDWDDDGKRKESTVCFGVETLDGGDKILFQIIDPSQSPWPDSELLGRMLSRENSLKHASLEEVFAIVENLLHCHPAIRDYLSLPSAIAS